MNEIGTQQQDIRRPAFHLHAQVGWTHKEMPPLNWKKGSNIGDNNESWYLDDTFDCCPSGSDVSACSSGATALVVEAVVVGIRALPRWSG